MTEAIWTAIIVAIPVILTSVVVPIWLARMAAQQKAADRDADWRRQDELADRQAETAAAATRSREDLGTKLEVIHHLVNGNVTDAMNNELDSLLREVSLRRELKALKRRHNEQIDPVGLATIEVCEVRINELRAALKERLDAVAAAAEEEQKLHDYQSSRRQAEVHEPDQKKGD